MHENLLLPGRDGGLDEGINLWRKGIVYTKRPDVPVGPGYRVSASFKTSGWRMQTDDGFHSLYNRVAFVANRRVGELTAAEPSLAAGIVCQGWRLLGDAGNVSTTFIMLALRSRGERHNDIEWEQPPA